MAFVYKFVDFEDNIIYIGKTRNLEKRMQQHFNGTGHLPMECYQSVARIFFIEVDGKTNVDMYETFLINKYIPKYNVEKQFRELVNLHSNEFILIEEIHWKELFFRFNDKGIMTSKAPIPYPFFHRHLYNFDKSKELLKYNLNQLIYRQGIYEHYLKTILKENDDFLNYVIMFHKEVLNSGNINTTYGCFDEPLSIENDAFEYTAIKISEIKTINIEYLLIMVQTKMLVRITNEYYGIVAHTPYALGKFEKAYITNEYEN